MRSLSTLSCVTLLLAPTFSSQALGAELFTAQATSTLGQELTLTFPLEFPASGVSLGALVCSSQSLSVESASLWMEHPGHGGHPGPRVSTRPLDPHCFQVNSLHFPHAGTWQLKVVLSGEAQAVFEFPVRESLSAGTVLAQGENGTVASLRFPSGPLTSATSEALICSNEISPLQEAILWMPDMGHGSSPTVVAAGQNRHCSVVSGVDFFMPGLWEVRSRLDSGEMLTFAVHVKD